MAKLTLSFKGHLISIHHLGENPAMIGRELDCDIPIDSLAVGPNHALVSPHSDGYTITAIDPEHPVMLNNEAVEQAPLHHGDLIQIGKHTLHFSEAAQEVAPMPAAPQPQALGRDAKCALPELAYVQIQSGPEIGRVLALRRDSTRLTRAGADHLVISRRGDSYALSCEDPHAQVLVDGAALGPGTEWVLADAVVIELDELRCQFFCGGTGAA